MGGPGYGGEAMYGEDYGGYGGGYGGESGESMAETASLRDNIRAGEVITPGLVFIGTGSQAELLEKAAQEGVDAIFVFDIEASQNTRRNVVNNKTRIRLVQTSGNAVGATSSLINTEVERARMRGVEDDLQKNIDRLFTMFDQNFALTSLPPLNAGHAENRVQQLLAKRESLDEDQESSMDLQVMFESRLFHSMGLLTDEQLSTVYQIVLEGNEGISLSTGSEADRKLVLGDLLASSN